MTLSPVFRSAAAVRSSRRRGSWSGSNPARSQARAVETIHRDLEALIDGAFRSRGTHPPRRPGRDPLGTLPFLQEYFFLVLFRSLFESLGIPASRLDAYAELNFCIKGTITAADNLFDEQAKSLLPLRTGKGARFLSILQLMCFERLIRRSLDRMMEAGEATPRRRTRS
jgi:hypothetical protein